MENRHVSKEDFDNLTTNKFFDQVYDFQKQGINNIHSENPVSELFFSTHNINILQEGLRYMVYKKTQKVIDKQSENELLIIMRSIYLQYAKHMPYNIIAQVKNLNSKVLDFAVSKVSSEVIQYYDYKQHASTLPIPLDHAVNVSQAGTKILHNNQY
jgi:tRNA uridine 5-carbamoylmethylation protein Kti12